MQVVKSACIMVDQHGPRGDSRVLSLPRPVEVKRGPGSGLCPWGSHGLSQNNSA